MLRSLSATPPVLSDACIAAGLRLLWTYDDLGVVEERTHATLGRPDAASAVEGTHLLKETTPHARTGPDAC